MKKIIRLSDFDFFPKNKNTKFELSSETVKEEISNIALSLSERLEVEKNYVCYVLGMGARPKSIYKNIEKIYGIQLIRYRSVMPDVYAFFFPFVASFEGVLKVEKFEVLPRVFDLISDSSMAAICCFSKKYEGSMVRSFLNAPKGKLYKNLLKNDPSYVMLLVDSDCYESTTGMMKVVSYGVDASYGLISLLK